MPLDLRKVEHQAPGLVSLTKTAAVSLDKAGIAEQPAALQLVLDHSGSMRPYYRDGSVQRLAEQALALSVNLDDDGTVPLSFFGSYVERHGAVRLDNYRGLVDQLHNRVHWGMTDYVAAMHDVIEEHESANTTAPGLVIFQTDGEPDDPRAAERLLKRASTWPIFWAFVGFGSRVQFLRRLGDLRVGFGGRTVDNAVFFHADDPRRVTDQELYDGITAPFAKWLVDARAAGILT